jgi:pyruvate carboxylase
MRVIRRRGDARARSAGRRREAMAAFGKDEVYLEKLVERARHVEVQILGDSHGSIVHLFERDCTVQRRTRRWSSAPRRRISTPMQRQEIGEARRRHRHAPATSAPARSSSCRTPTPGKFYFIEVNPRVQVEHTVTEEVTGIDIVKAQIRIAGGAAHRRSGVRRAAPGREIAQRPRPPVPHHHRGSRAELHSRLRPHHRLPRRHRLRHPSRRRHGLSGAVITRFYDPLLEKVTAWAPTPDEAIARMDRALREFRIRGVATNLAFLENVINHPDFATPATPRRFIDETPELFEAVRRRDRRPSSSPTSPTSPSTATRTRNRGRPRRRLAGRPAAAVRAGARPRHQAALERDGPKPSPTGCAPRSARWSPTRPCATRTSRCSRPACAPTIW